MKGLLCNRLNRQGVAIRSELITWSELIPCEDEAFAVADAVAAFAFFAQVAMQRPTFVPGRVSRFRGQARQHRRYDTRGSPCSGRSAFLSGDVLRCVLPSRG